MHHPSPSEDNERNSWAVSSEENTGSISWPGSERM
jgi:hypothetical protein